MLQLNGQTLGVDQGTLVLFSDFEEGGPMWSGSGPREMRRLVKFSACFSANPIVHVSLSLWDVHHATNMRAEIAAEAVTKEGFDVVFRTWGDTRIARMRADWFAFGALPHEDNWDID